MKSFTVLLVLLYVGWKVEGRALMLSSGKQNVIDGDEACITELNLDRNKINAVNMAGVLPEDDNFVKFMGCIGKKTGLIKTNGKVDFDKITEGMLDVARKDPEITPSFFEVYRGIVTTAVQRCRSNPPTAATEGLTLIKTFNCSTKSLNDVLKGN